MPLSLTYEEYEKQGSPGSSYDHWLIDQSRLATIEDITSWLTDYFGPNAKDLVADLMKKFKSGEGANEDLRSKQVHGGKANAKKRKRASKS